MARGNTNYCALAISQINFCVVESTPAINACDWIYKQTTALHHCYFKNIFYGI